MRKLIRIIIESEQPINSIMLIFHNYYSLVCSLAHATRIKTSYIKCCLSVCLISISLINTNKIIAETQFNNYTGVIRYTFPNMILSTCGEYSLLIQQKSNQFSASNGAC